MSRLLRVRDVSERTGLARSTIYQYVARGMFPAPRRLTAAAVAWREEEVSAWIDARPVADSVAGPHRAEAEGGQ